MNSASGRKTIPGGQRIIGRYREFRDALPALAAELSLEIEEITYNDYSNIVSEWLKQNSL